MTGSISVSGTFNGMWHEEFVSRCIPEGSSMTPQVEAIKDRATLFALSLFAEKVNAVADMLFARFISETCDLSEVRKMT